MTMPVLPALTQPTGEPGPLTDILDALPEDAIASLVETAADWAASEGSGSELEDDPEASVDTDTDTPAVEPLPGDNPVTHDEDTETLEDEAAESEDEQAAEAEEGTENYDGLLGQVQTEAAKADGYVTAFDDLVDQATASEDEGGDPDAVESLKDEATDYIKEIVGFLKEAESARKDEDAEGIAQAGLMIKEKCELIETLLQQAAVHAKTNTPAPPADGAIPTATPALALWAKRYNAG
jgi:hypothetical protein